MFVKKLYFSYLKLYLMRETPHADTWVDQHQATSTLQNALAEPSMPLSEELDCVRSVFPVKFRMKQPEKRQPQAQVSLHSLDTVVYYTMQWSGQLISSVTGFYRHLL